MDEILKTDKGRQILEELGGGKCSAKNQGCTATVVLFSKQELYIANCGDSRTIILYKDQRVEQPLEDHKPDNQSEKKRIQGAGGFVSEG